MKKIKTLIMLLIISTVYSQTNLKLVLNETFDNNKNGWKITDVSQKWKSSIQNGSFIASNYTPNYSSYFRPSISIPKGKDFYEIDANLTFSIVDKSGISGVILINEEKIENDIYSLKFGLVVGVDFYSGGYYLTMKKTYENVPLGFGEIENFQTNKLYNLKIKINNTTPNVKVYLNEKLTIDFDGPIFNFTNIGIYNLGISSNRLNDLKVRTSESGAFKTPYDVFDLKYLEQEKRSLTIKGNQYLEVLNKFVPTAVVVDNYDSNKYEFEEFKSTIIEDQECKNIKTSLSPDKEAAKLGKKICSFDYKQSKIYIEVTKDNKFMGCYIVFKSNELAADFFNLYSKLKEFNIKGNTARSNNSIIKSIYLNNNSVSIYY